MQGMTLIELIVAMTIATILLAMVVPGFQDISASVKRSSVINGVNSSILLARSESVKRGTPVSICPSSDGVSCRSGDTPEWDQGWIVFVDDDMDDVVEITDGNLEVNAGEELLRVFSFEHPIHSLTGSSGLENGIRFKAGGFPKTAGQLDYCETQGSYRQRKTISLNVVGRVNVVTTDGACP